MEQRGGGSSVFEPLVRGGSFDFQLPMGGGSSYFRTGIGTPVCQPAESSIQAFPGKSVVV